MRRKEGWEKKCRREVIRNSTAGYFSGMGILKDFPQAILFDRDGTLVEDVPYNGDPRRVRPLPGAVQLVRRLRAAGVRCGVVSNQSGIARGLLTRQQVDAVNHRVDDVFGPFDTWQVCPHGPGEGCRCRKPEPGMVLDACRELGVAVADTVVIGDIGADMDAAAAAGARAVMVPTPVTRTTEIEAAPLVAHRLADAVDLLGRIPDAALRSRP